MDVFAGLKTAPHRVPTRDFNFEISSHANSNGNTYANYFEVCSLAVCAKTSRYHTLLETGLRLAITAELHCSDSEKDSTRHRVGNVADTQSDKARQHKTETPSTARHNELLRIAVLRRLPLPSL
jgi:hypothetical protein